MCNGYVFVARILIRGASGYDREGRACPKWSKAPGFHQVTSKDVVSGQWKSVAGIAASEATNVRNGDVAKRLNFCPRCWVARVQRVSIPKNVRARIARDSRNLMLLR